MKKAQRKRQKVKRKLSFTRKAPTYADNFPPSTGSFMDSPNEAAVNTDDEEIDALGVDLDVVEMTVANPDSEKFTYEYLQDCRKKLMLKVNAYRSELESLKLDKAKMAFKHRSQIDRIRSCYQTIAFATTRTGKIVKTAMETSSAAANIMKELESTYE